MGENETDIVRPSELEPIINEKILDAAKKISAAVRSQKLKYTGRSITVGIPGKVPQESMAELRAIFKKNGWDDMKFQTFENPDPGDPRSSSYTNVTLWSRPDHG